MIVVAFLMIEICLLGWVVWCCVRTIRPGERRSLGLFDPVDDAPVSAGTAERRDA